MSRLRFLALLTLVAAPFVAPLACANAVSTNPFAGSGGAGPTGTGGGTGEGGASTATGTTGTANTSSSTSGGGGSGPCVTAEDCAAFSDTCNVGTCINAACEKVPQNDGTSCDDGKQCTLASACQAGECMGTQLKACPSSGPCTLGMCDVVSDTCSEIPANDGQSCVDNDPCTLTGFCQAGVCAPGQPVDCSFLDSVCGVGVCDPQLGCVAMPLNDGSACDDGLFCTINDTCTGGTCSGDPNTCAPPGDICLIGTCDENTNSCISVPGNNGSACNDQSVCTSGETCNNGLCNGGAPANQGGGCDDNKDCTANDVCNAGVCAGTPIVACQNGDGCCPAGCTLATDSDCNALGQPFYDASFMFQDQLDSTTMMLAWDGTNYWSCSGGSPGTRLAQYTAAGTLVSTFNNIGDMRASFTKIDGVGPLLAREYSSNQVKVQNSPGIFGAFITLNGGALDAQSGVVYDTAADQFVAFNAGTVTRWNAGGNLAGTITLVGFGNLNNENQYPQNRGVVARGGWYLTYAGNTLSAWDGAGTRVKTTVLNGAGQGFDSYFSLSYANGMIFIVDQAHGTWRGYDVGL